MAEGLTETDVVLERLAARRRESEHRVKNTLQLISSIVLLQGRRASEETARQALRAVQLRVAAVSVAHRQVTWSEAGEQVEAAALIRELVGDLASTAGRDDVAIELDLEAAVLPGRSGAPLALLVSECVSNALRHAFPPDRPGRVQVILRRTGDELELTVADNGVGMSVATPPQGFGLSVAQLMTQQLRGRLAQEPAEPGVRIVVTLPMDSPALRG